MVEHVQPMPDAVVPAAPRARRRPLLLSARLDWAAREALLLPVVALYLVSLFGSLPRQALSDTWFVIVGGREIVQHGLPLHDTLTLWSHGQQWIDQQWLGQLFFYGLYALGGLKLALFGHAAAIGTAFIAAIAFARMRGGSTRAVCWVSVPAIFLLVWGSWNARAQSLAFVLFVALVWLLSRDARTPSRKVFLVLPIVALWANIHGTAVTGAMLVAAAGLAYAWENRRDSIRRWGARAAALVLAPFACLLASPYASDLPSYYHHVLFNSWFRDYIIEWKPTTVSVQTAPFYVLGLLMVWLCGRYGSRLVLTEKVVLFTTLLMGMQTFRSVVWFVVAAVMLLPVLLDGLLKQEAWSVRFRLVNRALVVASAAGALAAVVVVAAKPQAWFETNYPAGALSAVSRVEAKDAQVRVFANEQYSDWLLLRRPELRGRVAYDVRFELLSRKRLKGFVDARRLIQGWQRVVAPFELFVLKRDVEKDLAKALLRQPGARTEYRGHNVVVIYRPAPAAGDAQ